MSAKPDRHLSGGLMFNADGTPMNGSKPWVSANLPYTPARKEIR